MSIYQAGDSPAFSFSFFITPMTLAASRMYFFKGFGHGLSDVIKPWKILAAGGIPFCVSAELFDGVIVW